MKNTQHLFDALGHDHIGENHVLTSINTPLRADAFHKDDELKIELIQKHFKEIMQILGLDLTDDSLQGTPNRVAKMFVKEIFGGLNPDNRPETKLFENKYEFKQILIEKDISFFSNCEHHFVPFFGKAHVAYIPDKHVIGLSKINRLVKYYAQRPQVQERLTQQIGKDLQETLGTQSVAIILEAKHLCVASRGVEDTQSSTVTVFYGGEFKNDETKKEFLALI
jgi:GTP cyclohydrolase IA